MKKRLSFALAILLIIIFIIGGYSAKHDINDMAYVVAIGIDKGETSDFKVSFQLSIPSKNTSQSDSASSSDSDTVIDTVECASVESAISLVNRICKQEN